MTDVLIKWSGYRKTTHTDYEADTLGDEMAKEIERLRYALQRLSTPVCFGNGETLGTYLPDYPHGREIKARMDFAASVIQSK